MDPANRRASIAGVPSANRFEPYPAGDNHSKSRRLSFAPDPPSWSSSRSTSTSQLCHQFSDLVATLVNGDAVNEEFLDDASVSKAAGFRSATSSSRKLGED